MEGAGAFLVVDFFVKLRRDVVADGGAAKVDRFVGWEDPGDAFEAGGGHGTALEELGDEGAGDFRGGRKAALVSVKEFFDSLF